MIKKQIEKLNSELDAKEKEIADLSEKDAQKLVHSAAVVEKIMGTIDKKPEIDNNAILQKLTLDNSIYEKFAVFLCSHFQLTVGPIVNEGKIINFNDYAAPSESWACRNCDFTGNPVTTIQCSQCFSFRPIDTYPNILYDAPKITEDEIILFTNRRKLEKKMICGRDLITSEVLKCDECWYLISSEWLKEWKAFIFNKPGRKAILCSNERIGVLPPGPIYNHVLLMPDGKTPKSGLQKVYFFGLLIRK